LRTIRSIDGCCRSEMRNRRIKPCSTVLGGAQWAYASTIPMTTQGRWSTTAISMSAAHQTCQWALRHREDMCLVLWFTRHLLRPALSSCRTNSQASSNYLKDHRPTNVFQCQTASLIQPLSTSCLRSQAHSHFSICSRMCLDSSIFPAYRRATTIQLCSPP
jgi:hypothetical protein